MDSCRPVFFKGRALRNLAGAVAPVAIFIVIALPASGALARDAGAADRAGITAGAPITVTSGAMEASRDRKVVTFTGGVAASGEFDLCSDELRIHYSDTDEVERIEAVGNVRIVQESKRVRGDRAVYDRVKKSIVVVGNAVARQCGDEVSGQRITVYPEGDSVEVTGGEGGRVRAVIMPEKKKCGEGSYGEEFQCRVPR